MRTLPNLMHQGRYVTFECCRAAAVFEGHHETFPRLAVSAGCAWTAEVGDEPLPLVGFGFVAGVVVRPIPGGALLVLRVSMSSANFFIRSMSPLLFLIAVRVRSISWRPRG